MNLLKVRLITGLIGYGFIAGGLVAGVLHYLDQGINWNWFLAILFFFLFVESLIVNLVVSNSRNKDKKRLVNIYMLTKVIKIVLSLGFVLLYITLERMDSFKSFILLYVAFYILFLFAELVIFSKIEKYIKSNNSDE